MKEPSLIHRIYNGLDERKGWPIIHIRDIVPVGMQPVEPVGEITPRAQIITYPMPRKIAKIPWWRRMIKEMFGI